MMKNCSSFTAKIKHCIEIYIFRYLTAPSEDHYDQILNH